MNRKELDSILKLHAEWLDGNPDGVRADLRGANLREADLSEADLSEADLYGANLYGANLYGANLCGANLSEADLRRAYLYGANLYGANLCGANLSGSDLRVANLYGADLSGANLYGAYLYEADLSGAILRRANLSGSDLYRADLRGADLYETRGLPPIACPEKGEFIGFKKAYDTRDGGAVIVELLIRKTAKRSSATTRKCRCSKAKVLSITTLDGTPMNYTVAKSKYDNEFTYTVGQTVEVKDFDPDRWNECAPGIHFFITRQEAVEY